MSDIGYPTTLCGKGDYYGHGCNECCHCQIVVAAGFELKEIGQNLPPETLVLAAGKAVNRMEHVLPGLTGEVLGTELEDTQDLRRLYISAYKSIGHLSTMSSDLVQVVFENQDTVIDPPFRPSEAASNTGYLRSIVIRPNWDDDQTLLSRAAFLLATAESNKARRLGRRLSESEIIEDMKFMMEPNLEAAKYPCPLLNPQTGKCNVYKKRPIICKTTGCFTHEELALNGCGPNYLYCGLNNSEPINHAEFYERVEMVDRAVSEAGIPLEFFLVRALAERNQRFAENPIGEAARINRPQRKRH